MTDHVFIDFPILNGFGEIVTPHGTDVIASGASVLNFTSSDSSVTITGTASTNTINFQSSGGGGSVTGVTASSPLASSGGSTPNLTLANPVPLSLGGAGSSLIETSVSTTGTINNLAIPTNVIRFTGISNITLNGIVSDSTNKQVTFINGTTNHAVVLANENAGSTAANRIDLPAGIYSNGIISILSGESVTLYYNPVSSRWNVLNLNSPAQDSSPGFLTDGTQTIGGPKTFISEVFVPNIAISSLSSNEVLFYQSQVTGSSTLVYDFDGTSGKLGVNNSSPQASVHASTTEAITVPAPYNFTATIVDVPQLTVPNTPTTTQINLAQLISGLSGTQDSSGGGYTANGSTYTYNFYTLSTDSVNYTSNFAQLIVTDDNSGNPFQWDLNWNSGWIGDSLVVLLDINGGGFNVGTSISASATSIIDYNNFGPPPAITPNAIDGYFASSQNHNYSVATYANDPNGVEYYSGPNSYSFQDNGDEVSWYQVQHSVSPTGIYKTVVTSPNSGHFTWTSAFNEGPNEVTGDTSINPTQAGYTTDGATRYYEIFGQATFYGNNLYSGGTAQSVTDVGAYPYYGVALSWTSGGANTAGFKLLVNSPNSGGSFINSDTFALSTTDYTDDFLSNYGTDQTITPNSIVPPASIVDGALFGPDFTKPYQPATIYVNSTATTAGPYAKIGSLDGNGLSLGSIVFNGAGVSLVAPTAFNTYLQLTNSGVNLNAYLNAVSGSFTEVLSVLEIIVGDNVIIDGSNNFLSGSISGSAQWDMPFRGSSYKFFLINFQSFHDAGRTITFPINFAFTPYLYGNSTAVAICSASTTALTISAAAGITGSVFVQGF